MGKETQKKKTFYKSLSRTGAAAALAILLTQPLTANKAWAAGDVPETIDINIQTTCPDIEGIKADKKKVTAFTHKLHAEKYLPGKSAYSSNPYTDEFTCAACHVGAQTTTDITATDKCDRQTSVIAGAGGGKGYKKQMHGMCINCHKEMKKAKETTGPTKCKACHG